LSSRKRKDPEKKGIGNLSSLQGPYQEAKRGGIEGREKGGRTITGQNSKRAKGNTPMHSKGVPLRNLDWNLDREEIIEPPSDLLKGKLTAKKEPEFFIHARKKRQKRAGAS